MNIKGFSAKLNPALLAIFLCLVYWVYLVCTAQMSIIYDAMIYEKLGTAIYQEGWAGYFKDHPKNEPLYPFLISLSMRLGNIFSISYQTIQQVLQLLILLSAQVLSLVLLKKLRIHPIVSALTILYLGVSPSLINASLSLFSEILTLPFILGLVFLGVQVWKAFSGKTWLPLIRNSLILGFLFVGITLIKGIYEYVFYLLIMFTIVLAIRFLILKRRSEFIKVFVFILTISLVFGLSLHYFKSLNKKYNGIYALTDHRGDFSLYSSASRRTEDLTARQILAGIAHTGGEGCCKLFFSEEECYFWGIHHYDSYGVPMLVKLKQTYPKEEVSDVMMSLSIEKIMQKPFQFTMLTLLEYAKMFFWESTQIGFVRYSQWQTKLYASMPFKSALRLIVSLLSMCAFLYTFMTMISNRKNILKAPPVDERMQIMCVILSIAFCHIALYSIFMTVPRFILPIAPLYLLMIAFSVDHCFFKNRIISDVGSGKVKF